MKNLYPKIRALTVYCGSQCVGDPAYDQAATELAGILAANGITLVYGGSGIGTMKVLADAMLAQGGKVVGVFTKSLREEELHPGLTETIVVETLAARKAEMIRRCDAIVALPGSFGTLDELFDAVAMRKMQTGGHHPSDRRFKRQRLLRSASGVSCAYHQGGLYEWARCRNYLG